MSKVSLKDLAGFSEKNRKDIKQSLGQEVFLDTDMHYQMVDILLTHISPDPNQPRTYFDDADIECLTNSIKEIGLLQPISVRELDDKPDHFVIIAGERRYRAYQKMGSSHIPCIVMKQDLEQDKALALAENISRENLQDYEVYKAIDKMQLSYLKNGEKVSQENLANILGINRHKLLRYLSFDGLPIAVKLLLDKKPYLLTASVAQNITRFFKNINDKALKQHCTTLLLSLLEQLDTAYQEQGAINQSHLLPTLEQALEQGQAHTDDGAVATQTVANPKATMLNQVKQKGRAVATIKQHKGKVSITLTQEVYEMFFTDINARFDVIKDELSDADSDNDDSE